MGHLLRLGDGEVAEAGQGLGDALLLGEPRAQLHGLALRKQGDREREGPALAALGRPALGERIVEELRVLALVEREHVLLELVGPEAANPGGLEGRAHRGKVERLPPSPALPDRQPRLDAVGAHRYLDLGVPVPGQTKAEQRLLARYRAREGGGDFLRVDEAVLRRAELLR